MSPAGTMLYRQYATCRSTGFARLTAWVEAAKLAVDGKPDPEIVERLDRQLAKLPVDMAAVAALNAARWIVRQYEISMRLH
jgi:hypothetical protein